MVTIAQNAPLVYISFSAEITPITTETLISAMANCANLKVKQVYLLLSTPGGSVMSGMNLYNVLKGMPFELITHNAGNVSSIGNMVFLAGKKRYACPNSTFMFHGVGMTLGNNQRFEEKDLRERLGSILNDQSRIGFVIAQHTKLTQEEVATLFGEATTKDARYAVDKGIVDEIRDIQIPDGIPIISLVFQRQSI
jgi:ATP-dependent protease ClpP protease subunit